MKCWALLLVALAAAASGQNASGPGPARRALVIGNLNYTKLPKATNADREALLMADALGKAGFQVDLVTDMRMPDFLTQTQNPWVAKVQPGDVCVFYFSGYAVNGGDDNYLLPVNFDPQGAQDLEQRAYHLAKMQELLQGRTEAEKIFVIEGSRSLGTAALGLAGLGLREPDMQVSTETIFAFSAGVGQLQPKENGVARFTREVANGIGEPGLPLLEVFRSARQKVSNATQRVQVPLLRDNLLREGFYFHAPRPVAPPKEVSKAAPPKETGPIPGVPALSKRDRQEYVWIPPGTFKMGCVAGDTKCSKDEIPQHSVRISKGFWLGRTEVTVDAYRDRYLDGNQRAMPPKPFWGWDQTDLPMVNVTWEEAGKYCAWAGGRLPTEAEWEYAARAGIADQIYPGTYKEIREKANFYGKAGNDKYDQQVAPVRKFDPNPFGLFDMAGNVWEWVSDVYSESYYATSPAVDPGGPASGKEHAARGGSWDSDPEKHLRISIRRGFGKGGNTLGFRCALDDGPDTRSLLNLPPALAR